jgi:Fe(3+) dicitrate transport protein
VSDIFFFCQLPVRSFRHHPARYVEKSYSDALNTETPSANGTKGLMPSYNLIDLNLSYRYSPQFLFKLGVNNIFG